jgi:hypothetical protein
LFLNSRILLLFYEDDQFKVLHLDEKGFIAKQYDMLIRAQKDLQKIVAIKKDSKAGTYCFLGMNGFQVCKFYFDETRDTHVRYHMHSERGLESLRLTDCVAYADFVLVADTYHGVFKYYYQTAYYQRLQLYSIDK